MRIHLSSRHFFSAFACLAAVGVALALAGGARANPQPTVASVAVPANATYTAGQNLDFTVTFSGPVTVDTSGGTPSLPLTIGAASQQASYVSGTGTSALVFRYTVQAGDADSDGIATGAALTLNGGTIVDQTDGVTNADPTLNSVGSTTAVLVDAVVPTVSSVNVPADSTYSGGQNLDFTVHFSENVVVDTAGGTPRVALTVGSSTVNASYVSGSGGSALLFRYTVQPGDTDSDGIAVGALSLNGGTLKDAAGNNATLTLNSVGSTAAVNVDAVAPTVSSVNVPASALYKTGQQLAFTVNFSENVVVDTTGGTPQLPLTIGSTSRQAAYVSGSGTAALVFRYTVQTGDADSDGITVGASAAVNGGTLKDAAGNNATLTLASVGATTGITVDAVAPTISSVALPADGSFMAAKNIDITVHYSEPVVVTTTGGVPYIGLTIGAASKNASYLSGTGSKDIVFRYTVAAGDTDNDGIGISSVITLNGGTLQDSAGNTAAAALGTMTGTLTVDTTAPVQTSVVAPASKTYKTADSIDFQVVYGEKVVVTGAPRLVLTIGTQTKYADYLSGSGTTTLTFRYTVVSGDQDTDGVGVSNALDLNNGTVFDAAGNPPTLTLTGIPSLAGVLVDGTKTGTGTTPPPGNGGGGGGGTDTTPPSSPPKLSAKIGATGRLYLNFGRSTDDTGVAGYRILENGRVVKTITGTSFLLPLNPSSTRKTLIVQVEAVDKAGNHSAPVTVTLTRIAPPKGLPKTIPAWAYKLARWSAAPKASRGKHPATPKHLPRWYGKWHAWHIRPYKVKVG